MITTLILSATSFAQIAHDLEIYAEGGEKFTVTINGRVLNEEPASRVELKNIDYDLVHLIINFEDNEIPNIEKKYFQISSPVPADKDKPVIAVAKIIEKKGKYKLRYASTSPKKIQQNTIIINQQPQSTQQTNGVSLSNGKVVINW
jgi:hypothetical protein